MAKLRFYQRQHSDRKQRVSAEIEEVRVPAYRFQAQEPGPDSRKLLFDVASGCFVGVLDISSYYPARVGLCALTCRCATKACDRAGRRRQAPCIPADFGQEMRPQCLRSDVRAGYVVRNQTLVSRAVLTRDDADLADALALRQPRLDLAQLDAETANLHLEVVATQILDDPIGRPPAEIPRSVHASAGSAENGSATNRSEVRSGRFK